MQDPSAFSPIKPQFPEHEQLNCPRCESPNTKFCYYNNYNLAQPRYFCKNCRRYWTKGGALRNIPVGGGTRKNSCKHSTPKRANPDPNSDPGKLSRRLPEVSSSSTATATSAAQMAGNGNPGSGGPAGMYAIEPDQDRKILDMDPGGTFSSLLSSNGQFGNIFEGLNPDLKMGGYGGDLISGLSGDPGQNPNLDGQSGSGTTAGGGGENYLESGEWGNSNGWPDLAIYTPSSSSQ